MCKIKSFIYIPSSTTTNLENILVRGPKNKGNQKLTFFIIIIFTLKLFSGSGPPAYKMMPHPPFPRQPNAASKAGSMYASVGVPRPRGQSSETVDAPETRMHQAWPLDCRHVTRSSACKGHMVTGETECELSQLSMAPAS